MLEWVLPLTDACVTLVLLLVGGNLGSFLNVVVYRLPRGESVVTGGSRCPACGRAIRWHDNVPVIGWLLLRGRCRDCGAEIAPGYPLMEAAAAIVLGGVAAAELLSGGGTFPGMSFQGGRAGSDNLLLRPDLRLILLASFHAWLLFNLMLGAAVSADGKALPRRWRGAALVVTVLLVSFCDWFVPVGILGDVDAAAAARGPGSVLRGLSIAAAGALAGSVVGATSPQAYRDGLVLAGAALGWQGVAVVALLAPLLRRCRLAAGAFLPGVPSVPDPPPEPGPAPVGEEAADGPNREPTHDPAPDGPVPAAATTRAPEAAVGPPIAPLTRLSQESLRTFSGRRGEGDLVVAAALHLILWRAWVGLWP